MILQVRKNLESRLLIVNPLMKQLMELLAI